MRKFILFILCLSCIPAFAQDGLFLQPTIGIGVGKVKYSEDAPFPIKFTLIPSVQIGIGYQFSHVVLSTGLGYMQTGFAQKITYTDYVGNVVGTGYLNLHYNHLVVPVTVGYKLNGGKKFSVTPVIGTEITYNISGREVTSGYGPKQNTKIPNDQFKKGIEPISVFGLIQLNLDFLIADRLSIVCTPKFDYMVTNMLKDSPHIAQHCYTFLLNAGIKWSLAKSPKTGDKSHK